MHPADIVALLRRCGKTQLELAEDLGVSHVTVSGVINSRGRSRRVAERIAEVTGTPVEVLWPGVYLPGGSQPRSKRSIGRLAVALREGLIAVLRLDAHATDEEIVAAVEALGERSAATARELAALRAAVPDSTHRVPLEQVTALRAQLDALRIREAEMNASSGQNPINPSNHQKH